MKSTFVSKRLHFWVEAARFQAGIKTQEWNSLCSDHLFPLQQQKGSPAQEADERCEGGRRRGRRHPDQGKRQEQCGQQCQLVLLLLLRHRFWCGEGAPAERRCQEGKMSKKSMQNLSKTSYESLRSAATSSECYLRFWLSAIFLSLISRLGTIALSCPITPFTLCTCTTVGTGYEVAFCWKEKPLLTQIYQPTKNRSSRAYLDFGLATW